MMEGKEKRESWLMKCGGNRNLVWGDRVLLMGIVNVTPDSFSDGGSYIDPQAALAHARILEEQGADILDIGAESTRPGHWEVSIEAEWNRLAPVLAGLSKQEGRALISIDTQKAAVAAKALQAGAHIINDIWGLQKDPEMAAVVAGFQAAVIIMDNRSELVKGDIISEVLRFWDESVEIALKAGISPEQIIVDPGIGFGKTQAQNLAILRRFPELKACGLPILLAASRKSLIGHFLNLPVPERLEATLAIHILGAAAGAGMIRVHDVEAHKKALAMAALIL